MTIDNAQRAFSNRLQIKTNLVESNRKRSCFTPQRFVSQLNCSFRHGPFFAQLGADESFASDVESSRVRKQNKTKQNKRKNKTKERLGSDVAEDEAKQGRLHPVSKWEMFSCCGYFLFSIFFKLMGTDQLFIQFWAAQSSGFQDEGWVVSSNETNWSFQSFTWLLILWSRRQGHNRHSIAK